MCILIAFSGLPGVGNSTVARALAREANAVYLRVDSIEAALKRSALRVYRAEDAGYRAAVAVAKDNLAHGMNVVGDSVNPNGTTRRWWFDAAAAFGAQLINVELLCSDMAEHRRRVAFRQSDIEGLDLPDWKRVQERDYEEWRGDRLVLDTSRQSVRECVDAIIAEMVIAGK